MTKAIRRWLVLGLLAGGLTFATMSGTSCSDDDKMPSDPGTAGSGSDPGTAGSGADPGTGGTTGAGGTTGTAGATGTAGTLG